MARYTVHIPGTAGSDAAAPERAVFVRDGWSWGAFLFGPLWLLWHRHWLMGALVLVLEGVLIGTLDALPLHAVAGACAHFLIALLFGLEGASLRRFALAKAGFAEVALMAGDSLEALERRFFESLEAVAPAQPGLSAPVSAVPHISGSGVIGSFPQARM